MCQSGYKSDSELLELTGVSDCSSDDCGCGSDQPAESGVSRRRFLGMAGLGLSVAGSLPYFAGPFAEGATDEHLIPADKKLNEDWVRSLFERGVPAWYSGEELRYIGMACGGICCGHVYLSGDGRLWHWDIFNHGIATATTGRHYMRPMKPGRDVDLDVHIRTRVGDRSDVRALDATGFPNVRFRGAYPMGFVQYPSDDCPVDVNLEAFSPFTPLDVDASSLPLTVLRYTVRNPSAQAAEVSLSAAMANPVLSLSGRDGVDLVNTVRRSKGITAVQYSVEAQKAPAIAKPRPDVVFEDFESPKYKDWTATDSAFGDGPVVASEMPAYQGDVKAQGKRLVNSDNTRNGEDSAAADAHTGTLTSKAFKIERRYIHALVGGGKNADQTALQLLIGGEVVAKLAGDNNNRMKRKSFVVGEYEGKQAQLRIIDEGKAGWGNIGVDQIVFSDKPIDPRGSLADLPDYGDMTLAILDSDGVFANAHVDEDTARFKTGVENVRRSSGRPRGAVGQTVKLAPGESHTFSFVVAWRFANKALVLQKGKPPARGNYYAKRFDSSHAAATHLTRETGWYERTRLWHDTWYDSTLPYWLLDRTFINVSTLATGTCFRFADGRFYGWEGVGCCGGTCQHVWHYAQSVGRVFPELERIVRERVDYDVAYQPNGALWFRGGLAGHAAAIDGQCGTILRVYREHTMSADSEWLRPLWPKVKKSIEFLISQEGGERGVLTGKQMNTLDSAWYGPISWITSLYLATLRAGSQMATEMGDAEFATHCEQIIERGSKWLSENLFDGEYFYHRRDPKHLTAIGAGIGCLIDQVMGQGWAHQLALGRVLPKGKTVTALKSLWRYNFAPDVGPYRAKHKRGRWYAAAGEAGLLMCTFPKGGMVEAGGGTAGKGFAGYFNECMTGFEYQAAGHMVAEGLVTEGLAVTRAIHDRYHPSGRNPYNEIECGDHYARAMASHGVFIALCGFEHHGPKGEIGFAPRITPDEFRAPFVAAQGWGTFSQTRRGNTQSATIQLRWGKAEVQSIGLKPLKDIGATQVRVQRDGKPVTANVTKQDDRVTVTLEKPMTVKADQSLTIELQ